LGDSGSKDTTRCLLSRAGSFRYSVFKTVRTPDGDFFLFSILRHTPPRSFGDMARDPVIPPSSLRSGDGTLPRSAENVLIFGAPNVGKTHLAIALGRAVVEAGHAVLFTSATALLAALSKAVLLGAAGAVPFGDLPGAREEVEAVGKTLAAAGFEVDKLIDVDAFEAISLIAQRNHRVMHLSGYGVTGWLPDKPNEREIEGSKREPLSGLVIDEAVVLTEHEVLMQDDAPEVVTVGTDHLGRWGRTLRSAGCAVAIVAHEPLDDNCGSVFFKTFYAELVRGVTAGAAAMRARVEVVTACRSGPGPLGCVSTATRSTDCYRGPISADVHRIVDATVA
jgi:IstB-like ATP binding protein/CHAT domain